MDGCGLTWLPSDSGDKQNEEAQEGKRRKLVVDDEDLDDECNENKDELFDRVCALCDDGGDLLSCEGRCIRSFHPTVESGEYSSCESLCYSNDQVEAIQTFLCKNCEYQQHQCFVCGKLGSSDKSSNTEVFPCVSATCGHFYHPMCVSKLISPEDHNEAHELQKQIVEGNSFTCPAHKCCVCKKGEDKSVSEMQFAVCRRCPKVYHRKCLPRNILFEGNDAKGVPQRAWEGLLTNRILIYCMDHKICRNILTPRRDHLIFPDVSGKKEWHPTDYQTDNKNKLGWRYDHQSKQRVHQAADKNVSSDGSRARPLRNAEMEKRIQTLVESSTCSFNVEEFLNQQRSKCSQAYSTHFRVDKSITMGKVERSVKAIEAALKKIQEGCTIDDAKAVCEPGVLSQITKWKKKLAVYLSPFLHGMRYSSFGRHFTKVDKLQQVVSRLCYYVQDGDTVVDFCCGSNDFCCLMKEELDRLGITCSFWNFDLIQPKNDFNFEKRNWMSVRLEELPEGSKLIMGLNPPFGVQAFHANQFIDKALQFRPKLLVLIVPKETERLDRKKIPYDLIWEDDRILAGKSFYLPGSVDVHDQQMEQWNLDPPPLYLWSRPDWTAKHKTIALEYGHIIEDQHMEKIGPSALSYSLMEENQDYCGDFSNILDCCGIDGTLEDLAEAFNDI